MIKSRYWLIDVTLALAVGLLATVVACSIHGGNDLLSVPVDYAGDSLLCNVIVRNLHDSGAAFFVERVSYPTGLDMRDFPAFAPFETTIVRICKLLLGRLGWVFAVNALYTSTFTLAAIACYIVLRVIGALRPWAFLGSVIIAFLPYHVLRGLPHVAMTGYWVEVPAMAVAIGLAQGRIAQWSRYTYAGACIALAILGLGQLYFIFHCGMLLPIATLIGYCRNRSMRSSRGIARTVGLALVAAVAVAIQLLPFAQGRRELGPNKEAVARHAFESYSYSLRPIMLFVPVVGHRWPAAAQFRYNFEKAMAPSGLYREAESTEPLGLLASIGLVAAMATVCMGRRNSLLASRRHSAAVLALATVALGAYAGFGGMFAFLINAQFRCWSRISVLTGILSVIVLMLAITQYCRSSSWRRAKWFVPLQWILAVGLSSAAVWDSNAPISAKTFVITRRHWESDREFCARLEQQLPRNAALFMLPVTRFPENGPIREMPDYEHLRPYLHTSTLRFSAAAIAGREAYKVTEAIGKSATARELVARIREAGYGAIWIDRRAYSRSELELETAIAKELPGVTPIVDRDDDRAVYPLPK